MLRVSVNNLEPGMILGRPIYNDHGAVLLQRGVALTPRYINSLRNRGYYTIHISDKPEEDFGPREIVSDKVRDAVRKHMSDLFTVIKNDSQISIFPSVQTVETPESQSKMQSFAPLIFQLCQDVEEIVDDVLSSEALAGVVSIKSHDNYTFEHSIEVTVVAVSLGRRLRVPDDQLRQLALGGLLHDIGKVIIPAEVLNKPGHLTHEEMALIQRHPQTGYEMVRQVQGYSNLLAQHVILQHHERQDGSGYPRALHSYNNLTRHLTHKYEHNRILFLAEIAAVADVFSALASDRPYRPAMEHHQIISTMRSMAGTHLNSEIVKRFLSILPVYPVGTNVIVTNGEYQGFQGVVIYCDRVYVDRPTIRLLYDRNGQDISPIEIETHRDPDIEIISATEQSQADEVSVVA